MWNFLGSWSHQHFELQLRTPEGRACERGNVTHPCLVTMIEQYPVELGGGIHYHTFDANVAASTPNVLVEGAHYVDGVDVDHRTWVLTRQPPLPASPPPSPAAPAPPDECIRNVCLTGPTYQPFWLDHADNHMVPSQDACSARCYGLPGATGYQFNAHQRGGIGERWCGCLRCMAGSKLRWLRFDSQRATCPDWQV